MKEYQLLIAEDDLNLGQILKEYLELKGYKATLTRDGQEAVDSFKVNHYDLCILDVMMPKKDGFAVGSGANGDDQLTGSTEDILPSSVRSMLSAGQPEKHEHQDRRNNGEHTKPERPRNVCQHRGIGRGFADLPEHVPCLVDIGPVPSPPYRTMSDNNLLEAQTLRQLRTGKRPVYMHVENVLKPANEFSLKSRDAEKRSCWSRETGNERHRLR